MSSTSLTTRQVARARAGARRVDPARVSDRTPWSPADRLPTLLLLVLGVALIAVAWVGASGTTQWDTQLRWTSLAMVGVVVVCVGVGVWLYRGFLRIRTEARAVRRQLEARIARSRPQAESHAATERVTATGMAHHHRPDCLLVAGKTVRAVEADDELRACGVCT